jgi:hypothetical protein
VAAQEPIRTVAETDAIVADLLSGAGEEYLENLDYSPAKDAEQYSELIEDVEDVAGLDSETIYSEDVNDELYSCGLEFVGGIIQDCLDEEDGEAHLVIEAPDASIAECSEAEEEDEDVCIHKATKEDCFENHTEQVTPSASSLLLDALDDGRLQAAMKSAAQKEAEAKKSAAVLLASLDNGSLEVALKGQKKELVPSVSSLLLSALDDGRLDAAVKAAMQEEAQEKKLASVLLTGLEDGSLEAALKDEKPAEKDEAELGRTKAQSLLLNALENNTLEGVVRSSVQRKDPIQARVQSVLVDALEDNSLEKAIKSVYEKDASEKAAQKARTLLLSSLEDGSLVEAISSVTGETVEEHNTASSSKDRARGLLLDALDDGSLESAIQEVMTTEEVEQKQELEAEKEDLEEEQDLPRFHVRPAFRPENTFFFEMMCNLLDCSLDGVGRSMFPEPEEEGEELSLPSAASLAPCTRRAFARHLVPTGPLPPVPAENFPMDCLPPLEQQTLEGVLSGPGRLPEATSSSFDPLCCRSAGHVVQGVQWFTPCRSAQQLPKEEVLPCPELQPEKEKLGQAEAATRIQKAFREHAARATQARYFSEIQKMKILAAQLAAPVAPASAEPAGLKSLTPIAPTAPKSPSRKRRPRPSTSESTTQQPTEGMIPSAKPEIAPVVPQAPSSATPKSAPMRKRRPVPSVDLPTFRMDTDTEEAPTKEATTGLAKEFMALDAELYNLDVPSRPVTPKSSRPVSQKSPRAMATKPVSALMLDLADDSKDMRHARLDASKKQKERMEAVYSNASISFSAAAPMTPSKRSVSLGSKQSSHGGKMLPALTPRRSQALVTSGNHMANQVNMASTPRGRYF